LHGLGVLPLPQVLERRVGTLHEIL
jgi:hypothetical protein